MTFKRHVLLLASFLLMRPGLGLAVAQEQRPAIIPLAQGAGGSSSASASSGLSDGPIAPGEVVHINVFDAPDFSLVTRVSEAGDVPYRFLVGAKLRELEHAVKHATSEEEMRSLIARLSRQRLDQSNAIANRDGGGIVTDRVCRLPLTRTRTGRDLRYGNGPTPAWRPSIYLPGEHDIVMATNRNGRVRR